MCAKKASNLIQIKHKHSDRPPPLVRIPEHFHLPEERFLSLSNVSFLFNLSHLIKDQHLKEKKESIMLVLKMSDTIAPSHQNQDPNNEVFTETHLSAVSTSNAPLVILTS